MLPKPVVDCPRPFDVHELFFSTTDRKGIITSCNDIFVRVSGYSPGQLLGAPHNVIRHPHMPRCVFRLLWDYLLAGKDIGAYVKNRAETGEYYWVFAVASPIADGFLSIRVKPTSDLFAKVPAIYAELLQIEAAHGADWRAGMQASGERLSEVLASTGFASYDEFMTAGLVGELRARDRHRSTPGLPRSATPRAVDCKDVFSRVGALDALKADLPGKKSFLDAAVRQLGLLSINAAIGAAHTGAAGRSLAVVAEEISRVSGQVREEIPAFGRNYQALCDALTAASFRAAVALLQDEMARHFQSADAAAPLSEQDQVRQYGRPVRELVRLLNGRSDQLVDAAAERVAVLRETLGRFLDVVEVLSKVVKSLRFAHATGKVEAECFAGGAAFSALLEDLRGLTDEFYTNLDQLRRDTSHAAGLLRTVRGPEGPFAHSA